jgi:hypothetical protein
LVADPGCKQSGTATWAFEFRSSDPSCILSYPKAGDVPQEVLITNNSFEIDQMQDGETIKFAGTFTSSDTANGTASSSAGSGCGEEQGWSAKPGDLF